MQQILKKVIRTTSMTMCLSVAVAIVPTVTQAHDDVVININSAHEKAPVVTINELAEEGASFGGMYFWVSGRCEVSNPIAGNACACSDGFTTVKFENVNGEGGRDIYWCWK